jgi:hypothetical protein
MQSLRISLPMINALEINPDARDYSLLADEDNILIKEHSRGSGKTSSVDGTFTITHNLGYKPHFYLYARFLSGRMGIVNGFNIFGEYVAYATNTQILLAGLPDEDVSYFIFYDDVPE